MDIFSAFPSKFLKSADASASPLALTIKDVRMEEVGEDKKKKPVVFFEERDQGLVLNKTNSSAIAELFSTQTEGWIGKRIELYAAKTFFGSREVDCLRVRIPADPPPKQPEPGGDGGDVIPF